MQVRLDSSGMLVYIVLKVELFFSTKDYSSGRLQNSSLKYLELSPKHTCYIE